MTRLPWLVAAAAALAACQPAVTAPRLALTSTPGNVDDVTLTWTPPEQGDFRGYMVEARQVPGEFQVVAILPSPTTSLAYRFPTAVPELTDHEFRVRALPEPGGPRVSAALRFRRGLRAPKVTLVTDPGGPVLQLLNQSFAADRLEVTREVRRCDGSPASPAQVVALPVGTTSYPDPAAAEWSDGAVLSYRVAAGKGAELSLAVVLATPAAALAAPLLSASQVPAGVQLDLVNQSRCATGLEVSILRQGGMAANPRSSLSAPVAGASAAVRLLHQATTLDPDPGLFRYRACAAGAGLVQGCAPPVLEVLAGAELKARTWPTPRGRVLARTASGAFASLQPWVTLNDPARLRAPGPLGEDVLERAMAYTSELVADRSGHPHALLMVQGSWELVHAWHDGQAWVTTTLPNDHLLLEVLLSLAVGADGTIHAAWGDTAGTHLARWSAGAWSPPEAGPALPAFSVYWDHVAGDSVGEPHLVGHDGRGGTVHGWREAGAWRTEPVPSAGLGDVVAVGSGAAGPVLLGFDRALFRASVVARGADAWGPVEVIGDYDPPPGSSIFPVFALAAAPGGTRVLAALRGYEAGAIRLLWIKDASGTTVRRWFTVDTSGFTGAGITTSTFAAGFGPEGKAWLLENTSESPPAYGVPSILFEEP